MSIFRGSVRSQQSTRSVARWRLLLVIGAEVAVLPSAKAACIDPSALSKTTVSISRSFNAEERKLGPGLAGIAGTGWFLSPELVVTAAHVAEAMQLSSTRWKDLEVWDGKNKTLLASRLHRVAGPLSEKMALLALRVPFADAVSLSVRSEPLLPEEPVIALAYPKRHLRFASGRFVAFGVEQRYAGAALM